MFVAFAHKPVDLNAPDSYLLAQYQLPDGTYPVLCIGDHGSDPNQKDHNKHLSNTSCEACRISSAFLCPAPAGSTGPAPHIAMADGIVPPQPILRHSTYPPSAPPQAPPLA
ncbi:hypothetical protein [Ochrobactrum sp. POC9]|uniref:hypothetical protein n=1 Tax=Ochrobactrum sp. POC9 TaxID=2203419 RepID=UPI001F0AAFCF|nr:hypothetical protein [Ochrobactrum sp. POC9]MCH4541241.1 hypothetical protein [Ochrobactrum sp. A-1]